jgi:hypothetical protein
MATIANRPDSVLEAGRTPVAVSLGGALAAGAAGARNASLLIYPAYYCLVNGAIALLIYQRRAALARVSVSDPPRRPAHAVSGR